MHSEQIGNATLWLGDCREVMPTLSNISVVITDPPYGEKTHAGARTSGEKKLIKFDSITTEYFIEFCRQCVDLAKRWVVMTCAWQHAAKIEDSGLPLIRLGCWIKPNSAPQFTGDRPGTGWEAVAILHRDGKKHWNGGGHHAVWNIPKINGDHPTMKPPRLMNQWVNDFSDPGETILDPFMGSASTGVAAVQMGRKFIGIEKDQKYFDLSCRRIAAAQQQTKLEF